MLVSFMWNFFARYWQCYFHWPVFFMVSISRISNTFIGRHGINCGLFTLYQFVFKTNLPTNKIQYMFHKRIATKMFSTNTYNLRNICFRLVVTFDSDVHYTVCIQPVLENLSSSWLYQIEGNRAYNEFFSI